MLHNLKTKDMGTPLNKFYRYLLTHKIRIPLQKQFGKGNNNRNIISGIITIIHSSSCICIVYIFYISDGLIILEISCYLFTSYYLTNQFGSLNDKDH